MKLTLQNIRQVLKKDGVLVSWDPVAYNPLINIYRLIARNVRTPDEHPLTLRDIHLVQNYFQHVTIRYFWLTTLLVFLCMVLVQFRNPNQARFWKVVIAESQQWAWLYTPLARLDTLLLKLFPRLGALCWNVVIVAKNP